MKIWLTRHGQTNYNKQKLMQGLTDEPLNETGILQAKQAREKIGNILLDIIASGRYLNTPITKLINKIIKNNIGKYTIGLLIELR